MDRIRERPDLEKKVDQVLIHATPASLTTSPVAEMVARVPQTSSADIPSPRCRYVRVYNADTCRCRHIARIYAGRRTRHTGVRRRHHRSNIRRSCHIPRSLDVDQSPKAWPVLVAVPAVAHASRDRRNTRHRVSPTLHTTALDTVSCHPRQRGPEPARHAASTSFGNGTTIPSSAAKRISHSISSENSFVLKRELRTFAISRPDFGSECVPKHFATSA